MCANARPDALVLSRTRSFAGRYGQNPHQTYGSGDAPLPGFFTGDADDTGATAVFDARLDGTELTFTRHDDAFVDEQTGSTWNLIGAAIDRPLAGERLDPITHLDTFWFAWTTARPGTSIATPHDGA